MFYSIYVHPDLKTICVSNPHVACKASIVRLERVVSENSQSSYSWRVSKLGRVISLLNVRPHDFHSSLICRLCRFARDVPSEIWLSFSRKKY